MRIKTKTLRKLPVSRQRGAGLNEYVLTTLIVSTLTIGVISLSSYDVRALFATVENGLAGLDTTPVTRLAPTPARWGDSSGVSNSGSQKQAARKASMRQSIQETLAKGRENPELVRGDWQQPKSRFYGPAWNGYRL
jgi:hypothetical protein